MSTIAAPANPTVATPNDPIARATGPASWSAVGASVGFKLNDQRLQIFGIEATTLVGKVDQLGDYKTMPLARGGHVQFTASPGRVESFDSGYFEIDGTIELRSKGRTKALTGLRVHPDPTNTLLWQVADAKGTVWFVVDHTMYEIAKADRLAFPTMDLRAGPALAAWAGRPNDVGFLVGEMRMEASVLANDGGLPIVKSCSSPNWPNVGNFRADVQMETISGEQMRCQQSASSTACDGLGADDGRVVFAPNSTLRNSDLDTTADVPWHQKFTGNNPPYGNDQHPFLIWNLYRVDAAGKMEQIGRSGVKHAFVSTNVGCHPSSGCSFGHILGRRCGDTYSTGNNDSSGDLGPRSEILPATGQWGRCGSIYDDVDNNPGDGLAGCDGTADSSGNGNYSQRMIARESQIQPSLNAGATYYFESWYIVRDDINIYNTMGLLTVAPTFSGGEWVLPTTSGFEQGAAINKWVAAGSVAADRRNNELVAPEGHARVAVRAVNLGGGNYRYDYAVMNFDFARGVTQNAEPNLRVVRNLGFDAFSLPIPNGVNVTNIEFSDGDLDGANNWTGAVAGNTLTWTCPLAGGSPPTRCVVGTELNWGTLFRFSFTANGAPIATSTTLNVGEAGTPATYSVDGLGPQGSVPLPDDMFRDGFEQP